MDSTFASRLALARELRKMTQSELAAAVKMSTQAIWNYENRPDSASTRILAFTLADALQISPRWLATGVEDGIVGASAVEAGAREASTGSDAIMQSIGCLEAFLASPRDSAVLVEAALSLLKSTLRPASNQVTATTSRP